MLWSSWHNHTGDGVRFSYCADADLGVEAYRRALRAGPWRAFAITEHAFSLALPPEEAWPHQWYHQPARLWAHRTFREDKTAQYLDRLATLCDGRRIFRGLEVEIAVDGSLSMEPLLWPYLDVVVGSLHYLPDTAHDPVDSFMRELSMLLAYPVDILGHPFRLLSQRVPVPDEVIDETLSRAHRAGVAIEINAHMPFDRDAEVLRRAVARGVRVAFGLDAHTRAELSRHTYFDDIVAASGVDPDDINLFQPTVKSAKPRQPLVR